MERYDASAVLRLLRPSILAAGGVKGFADVVAERTKTNPQRWERLLHRLAHQHFVSLTVVDPLLVAAGHHVDELRRERERERETFEGKGGVTGVPA